jgi:hypothetical protein
MNATPEMPLETLLTLLRIGRDNRCDTFRWMPFNDWATGEIHEERLVRSQDLCLVALPYIEAIRKWKQEAYEAKEELARILDRLERLARHSESMEQTLKDYGIPQDDETDA